MSRKQSGEELHYQTKLYACNIKEIEEFMDMTLQLSTFKLTKSIAGSISNKIFYFSKFLQFAYFSGNNLSKLPKFCQISVQSNINNLDC